RHEHPLRLHEIGPSDRIATSRQAVRRGEAVPRCPHVRVRDRLAHPPPEGVTASGSEFDGVGEPAGLKAHPVVTSLAKPYPERAACEVTEPARVEDERSDRARREVHWWPESQLLIPRPIMARPSVLSRDL